MAIRGFAFTCQEEVGSRGAYGRGVPHSCRTSALILEGTTANDAGDPAPMQQVCRRGSRAWPSASWIRLPWRSPELFAEMMKLAQRAAGSPIR